ncbi:unnamed protein product [Chironomus riparius]|uniref:Chitin-binding type-2 domain-containing protein n=1 Tax=Chironomus riparius TaxID=315576 RepID=A0A9N9SAU7_9DIPT|nr:unnamed protein product [Chironomus riparius]CAG9811488.1 unnamed protein product [Chironomus riparius]
MNNILFISLILGCFIAVLCGRYDMYEFHDSHGRCWRCTNGNDCVRCYEPIARFNFPDPWGRECLAPTSCATYPGAKFPHQDITRYYLCALNSQVVTVSCFCDTVFDMRQQMCVKSDVMTSIGCSAYTQSEPRACT